MGSTYHQQVIIDALDTFDFSGFDSPEVDSKRTILLGAMREWARKGRDGGLAHQMFVDVQFVRNNWWRKGEDPLVIIAGAIEYTEKAATMMFDVYPGLAEFVNGCEDRSIRLRNIARQHPLL